jgi:hypothetical protein
MSSEHDAWLTELIHQQRHRDDRITKDELKRSWDRYLDARLAARAQGETMTVDPEPQIVPLGTGEIVSVQVVEGGVVVALYAPPSEDTESDDDTQVTPAPVIMLDPNAAEALGSLITLGAIAVYGQRRRLQAVETPPPPHGQQETPVDPPTDRSTGGESNA